MAGKKVDLKTVALRESVYTSLALKGLNIELAVLSVVLNDTNPEHCHHNFKVQSLRRRIGQVQTETPIGAEVWEALDTLAALNILKVYGAEYLGVAEVIVNPTLLFHDKPAPRIIEFSETTIILPFVSTER